ncbi:hypothetical protein BDP55DRAFT_636591 [Colletotrichum godetiae]|uniref:Uncharacterized protein n=1 Tax=Colletotrichum godetiae TaxID=1209918 RepID=A0AAJ0AAV3_9PEZI|nr:uncharacterized protein BDP55DRAFT_636591 [Colletotrichum godetiae]KAK1659751.1 hypothetical protein BDP55DRAFT_636591 [Colletotrichum godetiae]
MAFPTDDSPGANNMETKAREFGGSIKQQVSRLGHEAGVFSAVVYYNPISGRFDGAAFVPEGHDVPDVNRLLRVLLNGTEPIVLQHPARSSSSEPRTGTLLQDGNATATSEDHNVVDAAVALCCIGQPSSATDSPQKRPPDDARLHTTHGSGKGVCPDVAVGSQDCSDGPVHAGLVCGQNAASKARPISHANRFAEQQSFSAVGDAARGSVASVARQQSDASYRKPIPLGIVEPDTELGQTPVSNATNAKAVVTCHAQQTAGARRLRHFFQLASKIAHARHRGYPKGMANTQSAPVNSAIRHVDQTESVNAGLTEASRGSTFDHVKPLFAAQDQLRRSAPYGRPGPLRTYAQRAANINADWPIRRAPRVHPLPSHRLRGTFGPGRLGQRGGGHGRPVGQYL